MRKVAMLPTGSGSKDKGDAFAMGHSAATGSDEFKPLDSRFMLRVFYAFAALALISVLISVAGKLFGRSIAAVGHTEATTVHEIVVGNNVLAIPANMIRFEKARRSGELHRLDLYLKWPQMTGYTDADRDEFNNRDDRRNIVFLTIEETSMSRDMSGRLEPIYRRLIELPGAPGPAKGLRTYEFSEESGYLNESLVVGDRIGQEAFVARCLIGRAAAESLAGSCCPLPLSPCKY
jgi:hypothetical protein